MASIRCRYAVSSRRARVEIAQRFELYPIWRRRFFHGFGEPDLPSGIFSHLLARDARMKRASHELFRIRIGRHTAQIGNREHWPFRFHSARLALLAGPAMSQRCEEIQLGNEAARVLPHNDEDLSAGSCNLSSATTSRQPDLGTPVIADDRAVQVSEAIHLRAAQESDGYSAALQPVAKHLRHRTRGQRSLAQFAIPD